jgi:hypothetical protein
MLAQSMPVFSQALNVAGIPEELVSMLDGLRDPALFISGRKSNRWF